MVQNNCCKAPFVRFHLDPYGDCWFCCPAAVKTKIGNIYENTFDEIWYGKEAVEFRQSVLDGSYSKCNFDFCKSYFNYDGVDCDLRPLYPKYVELSYVMACNVRCIMCRDVLYYESCDNTKFFDSVAEKLLPMLVQAKEIFLDGMGEVFVSNHFRKLIPLISEKNPVVKYDIITNGNLCDEAHCREFGLLGKMRKVIVSVHATTKKTYDKIVRGGNFDKVMKNLKWLAKLKKNGEVDSVVVNFVVSSLNYREMVACVKRANKLGIYVCFLMLRNWDCTEIHKPENFSKYIVWEKNHREYKKFLKVLKKLKKMSGYSFNEPLFEKLQGELSDNFFDKIVKFFCKERR